jgi:SagB-type dehydrogenase family enzyme
MQSKIGLTVTATEQIIQRLIALSLLVSVEHCELDERIGRWTRTRREWASWGWPEAVEYHLTTYDYPFMEMGDGTDRKRMDTYSSAEVDRDRQKSYVDAERRQLPSPHERLAPVPMVALHRRIDKQPLNFEVLASMLTLTFAEIERIKPKWSDAPLIRRTSPSGGARHPTEAYVVAECVPGLMPGWYHVKSSPPELERIRDSVDSVQLRALFPGVYHRAPFMVRAVVILTSVFERNMYRYREPRTYRSIHMDAGHLSGTLEMLAASMGIDHFVQYAADEEAVDSALGTHFLEEGFQLCIALG